MNTETGKVYEGAEVDAAIARGEKLASIGQAAAERIRAGRKLLALEKRRARVARRRLHEKKQKRHNRGRDRIQKASRRANR